jgi:hypothetical protein
VSPNDAFTGSVTPLRKPLRLCALRRIKRCLTTVTTQTKLKARLLRRPLLPRSRDSASSLLRFDHRFDQRLSSLSLSLSLFNTPSTGEPTESSPLSTSRARIRWRDDEEAALDWQSYVYRRELSLRARCRRLAATVHQSPLASLEINVDGRADRSASSVRERLSGMLALPSLSIISRKEGRKMRRRFRSTCS